MQSYFTLAKNVGAALSEEQLADAGESAKELAGYYGNTEAYEFCLQEQVYLGFQLQNYYQEHYGGKTSVLAFQNDLAAAADAIQVEPAPALNTLDLQSVLTRALNSPFAPIS